MRDIIYIRHYVTELENPNIAAIFRRYGAKGYGFYWHLLERLYAEPSHQLDYDKQLVYDLAKATKLSRFRVKMILADLESLKIIGFRGTHLYCNRVDYEIQEVLRSKLRRERQSRDLSKTA